MNLGAPPKPKPLGPPPIGGAQGISTNTQYAVIVGAVALVGIGLFFFLGSSGGSRKVSVPTAPTMGSLPPVKSNPRRKGKKRRG